MAVIRVTVKGIKELPKFIRRLVAVKRRPKPGIIEKGNSMIGIDITINTSISDEMERFVVPLRADVITTKVHGSGDFIGREIAQKIRSLIRIRGRNQTSSWEKSINSKTFTSKRRVFVAVADIDEMDAATPTESNPPWGSSFTVSFNVPSDIGDVRASGYWAFQEYGFGPKAGLPPSSTHRPIPAPEQGKRGMADDVLMIFDPAIISNSPRHPGVKPVHAITDVQNEIAQPGNKFIQKLKDEIFIRIKG